MPGVGTFERTRWALTISRSGPIVCNVKARKRWSTAPSRLLHFGKAAATLNHLHDWVV
jgi:hypothetical protein